MAGETGATTIPPALARRALLERWRAARCLTEALCEPLEPEDTVVQAMPDASPVKWHLAHTSWFFETFVLKPHQPSYRELDPRYAFLFNSYYVGVGDRHRRDERGMITRPTLGETYAYRAHVDRALQSLLEGADEREFETLAPLVTLGTHHEEQHQELILTDLKYLLSRNPVRPAYRPHGREPAGPAAPLSWIEYASGLREVGFAGEGFCFDNETPRHPEYLAPFALGSRLVTNAEYLEFMEDGGYRRPELWLSDGWATADREGWDAPLYWERGEPDWWTFTLAGMQPIDPAGPVCHVSYYEADAYARWRGARLPTEAEWEVAAGSCPLEGNFVGSGRLHPSADGGTEDGLRQAFGDAWEWTGSPYSPYPGFRPLPGALGEYNGKFMCNQFVLRGGSCATPASHIRPTYRNFFAPHCRWQFSGVRLARDG